ncbi:MAG: DegT/DnrJ/EryC1/StrS family aminotransferase [Gammaproteobacteria bacterium]|nr:DegT/DnrJ/EryC1/StrS family aminotransferase [Gammaproteobacteria bacterium]
MKFIDLDTQYQRLREPINARIQGVLDHGQFILGPEVAELEDTLAAFTGSGYCISCASGTDALLLILMAYEIGPGDEIITSPFSFIATGEVVALLGANPVFVDIDPRTYNINPALIEAAITPNTKAIMPVSLFGQCADFDAINDIAERHALPVIEDGAQSFGASYKGRRSCALSTAAGTSFFPSKPLGAYGDAGAIFTDDDTVAKLCKELRVHGEDSRYHHPRIGINGRLDSLQAAVLLAKFAVFEEEEIDAREKIGRRYSALIEESFADAEPERRVKTPFVETYNTSVYAQYTVEVSNREGVRAALGERGIPTAVHYPVPLHLQPAFAFLDEPEGSFPTAEAVAGRVMSLPMHPNLSEREQDRVVSCLHESLMALELRDE